MLILQNYCLVSIASITSLHCFICTNCFNLIKTYQFRLINNFRSNSVIHKEMLAILAAVAEVIKEKDGKETNTEYFGALVSYVLGIDTIDYVTILKYK